MTKLLFSTEEELNIVALHEAEQAASKSSQFDSAYDQLKNDLENTTEEGSSPSSIAEDTPEETNDDVIEDSTDTPDPEEPEVPAQESFRNLKFIGLSSISTEGFFDSTSENSFKDNLKYLGMLGIHYGGMLLKGLFKGVLYLMVGIIKSLFNGIKVLTTEMHRKINSFENLKKEIADLRKLLESKKDSSDDVEKLIYDNQKIINSLKIGDSVDLPVNIKVANDFITSFIEYVDKHVSNEVKSLKLIIAADLSGTGTFDLSKLSIDVNESFLSEGELSGYKKPNDDLIAYHSKQTLPGDIKVIGYLPSTVIKDKNTIIDAYNHSGLFLGIDTVGFKSVENIHYMTKDVLITYLDNLEALCDLCIKHRLLYESVIRNKLNLRFSFKNYFNDLIHREGKTGFKNSFIEYVGIKNLFIDKVYLAAAMDVHDYAITTIKNSLSFIKDNAGKL